MIEQQRQVREKLAKSAMEIEIAARMQPPQGSYHEILSRAASNMNEALALLAADPVRAEGSEPLRDEIEATWRMIDQCYHLEPREVIEREAKTNGLKFGLVQAVFSLWKREPKEPADDGATRAQPPCFDSTCPKSATAGLYGCCRIMRAEPR